ncbi:hypothetical protein FKM82_028937 [Ascaphus truei]
MQIIIQMETTLPFPVPGLLAPKLIHGTRMNHFPCTVGAAASLRDTSCIFIPGRYILFCCSYLAGFGLEICVFSQRLFSIILFSRLKCEQIKRGIG